MFYGRILKLNHSNAAGFVKIIKLGDSVEVTVKIRGLKPNTSQYFMHESFRCPTIDINSDGEIDLSEIRSLSGPRIIELMEGVHESSYHLMLTDLKREIMNFEKRSVIVYQGSKAVGCAELDELTFEPEEEVEPESVPIPRPKPPRVEPEYHPPETPQAPSSWWNRLTDRLRNWWCRVRGRCS